MDNSSSVVSAVEQFVAPSPEPTTPLAPPIAPPISENSFLGGISIEKLSNFLLDGENKDKIRAMKIVFSNKIGEFAEQIIVTRKNIENDTLRLNAAESDKENPNSILQSLKSAEYNLERSLADVEKFSRQVEIYKARLPSEARTAKVSEIKQTIKAREKKVNEAIQAKGVFTRLKALAEQAEEFHRMKD